MVVALEQPSCQTNSNSTQMTKKLLVEGGGDMPIQGAKRYFEWIQTRREETGKKVLLLIPWASEREHHELIHDYCVWMSFKEDDIERYGISLH
jgi:hypothetical protein